MNTYYTSKCSNQVQQQTELSYRKATNIWKHGENEVILNSVVSRGGGMTSQTLQAGRQTPNSIFFLKKSFFLNQVKKVRDGLDEKNVVELFFGSFALSSVNIW